MRVEPSRGRVAVGLSAVAVVYGVSLLIVIVAVPTIDDQTLLRYGGQWTLAIFVQPLLVSLLTWQLLHSRRHNGSDRAPVGARVFASAYVVYSVLGGFSIAAGALPAALLVFFAVALTPSGAPANA